MPDQRVLLSLFAPDDAAARCTRDFFAADTRNPNTRKAYVRAATDFAAWCHGRGINDLRSVQPIHVATYIEGLQFAAPSIKLHLAALRMLFDWLVVGRVIPTNPATSVRGPRHVVKKGKTTVLAAGEARKLLDSIDTTSIIGLRDRALIAMMTFTFARVGAVMKMRVEDVYERNRRTWVRLHEKAGKPHEMPCNHHLDEYLQAYTRAAQLGRDDGLLFRSVTGRSGRLSERPMSQPDVYRMIRRRARQVGIETKIGCHTFRATGITEYLRNNGKLEIAQRMANHESPRTTGLYDRRNDGVDLDEVERILI